MSLYLLDTDTLTLLQRQQPVVTAQIAAHSADLIGITITTAEEQLAGRMAVLRQTRIPADTALASELLAATVESLAGSRMFPYTTTSLVIFDRLVVLKLNVGKMDLRIASIALDAGGVVVTRNRRDFGRVPGLQTEDWSI